MFITCGRKCCGGLQKSNIMLSIGRLCSWENWGEFDEGITAAGDIVASRIWSRQTCDRLGLRRGLLTWTRSVFRGYGVVVEN